MSHSHSTWLRHASGVATAAAVLLTAACADSTGTGPQLSSRLGNTVPLPPRVTTVCKVGPAGTYNFEAVSIEGIGSFLTGTPIAATAPNVAVAFTLAAGECKGVYQTGGVAETVIIREVALPVGITLNRIEWQTLAFLEFPDGPINTVTGSNQVVLEPFAKPHRVTFYNEGGEQPPGFAGCTPGFWKNSIGSWAATGISPTADFDATFGVDAFNPNITLFAAVGRNGGGINALARHAVAALLGAAHPDVDYPLTQAQIIAGVQAAIANGTVESYKNTLDGYNNLGCGLANDNSFNK